MSSIKTTNFEGDVAIGRNITAGGNADVNGNAVVHKNLRVEGWLDAPNIKGTNKGIFLSEEDLRTQYAEPHNGWWAVVLTRENAEIWVAHKGEWIKTDKTAGEISVDLSEIYKAIESNRYLYDALLEKHGTDVDTLKELIDGKTLAGVDKSFGVSIRENLLYRLRQKDGSDINLQIDVATANAAGVMSADDKQKLDKLDENLPSAEELKALLETEVLPFVAVIEGSEDIHDLHAGKEGYYYSTDEGYFYYCNAKKQVSQADEPYNVAGVGQVGSAAPAKVANKGRLYQSAGKLFYFKDNNLIDLPDAIGEMKSSIASMGETAESQQRKLNSIETDLTNVLTTRVLPFDGILATDGLIMSQGIYFITSSGRFVGKNLVNDKLLDTMLGFPYNVEVADGDKVTALKANERALFRCGPALYFAKDGQLKEYTKELNDQLKNLDNGMTELANTIKTLTTDVRNKQAQLSSSDDITVDDSSSLSLTEAAKRAVFNDRWDMIFGTLGGYKPDEAPDAEHPYQAYDLWLTYEEALAVDEYSPLLVGSGFGPAYAFGFYHKMRTMKPIVYREKNATVTIELNCFHGSDFETLNLKQAKLNGSTTCHMQKLKSLTMMWFTKAVASINAPLLEEVRFDFGTWGTAFDTFSFGFPNSPKLSLESLQNMASKSWGKAITITVHSDVFAKLIGDDESAAFTSLSPEEKTAWAKVLTDAQAKNITFATA